MKADRPYQSVAVAKVLEHWQSGERAVCLVAPTGAGKTHMSVRAALHGEGTVLWSAHRTELVAQGFAALHAEIGGVAMGVIAPGHPFERNARVQVSSTQTLIRRGKPDITPSVIVLDEFHHYVAEEFRQLAEWWPEARILGPTATPQRGDGRPLGDVATRLVVAAQYSELIEAGYLCDAVVYQPPKALEGGIANDPVETWKKYSRGMPGFAFCSSIKIARELAEAFSSAGLPAACIDAKTKKAERAETLRRFAAGELRVITNVDTMTEGVDVPAAGCCMLIKKYDAVGAYLQAAGRVLRPHQSKEFAVIIDLTGCTLVHCPPTIDRAYSLDGEGIRKGEGAENPVRNCLRCGLVYPCELDACPACGTAKPLRVKRPPRIFDIELEEVWAGENTKPDAKLREYKRLRDVQRSKGLSIYFVIKEYKTLFGEAPKLFDVLPSEKRDAFWAIKKACDARGMKPHVAAARFRALFGHYPAEKSFR